MQLSDIDLLEKLAILESRKSFWAYRRYINPSMKLGWWQREIAQNLQQFYEDFVAGKKPKLVIQAPPQHGKSVIVIDFITWISGKDPDLKTIFSSFSKQLGSRANLMCQRIYTTQKYQKIFPDTKIGKMGVPVPGSTKPIRNREFVEYVDKKGSFRNTTVKGAITGESLDIGIIDDPIKGRDAANSALNRDNVWDWFTDDFFTRFSENAGILAILTRWHVDDPIGRFLKSDIGDKVKVISYPAIATKDEKYRKCGEALFPQHKSLDFLMERKLLFDKNSWESLYQQNPQIVGGEIIRGSWFGSYSQLPTLKQRLIYADTAQKTSERNDYSVFQSWGLGSDGKLYLIDMIRGKWEAPELKRRAISFWNKHAAYKTNNFGQLRQMKVEDKASGTGLIQDLKLTERLPIVGIQRTKDKYTRLLDVIGYIEAGYVMLPIDGTFTNDFIYECESFTADDSHKHDDQVDPMIDAINDLLAKDNIVTMWENMI